MSKQIYWISLIIVSYLYFTLQDTRPFMNSYVVKGRTPYIVLIQASQDETEKTTSGHEKCVGTILDKNWILTTANCVGQFSEDTNITVTANLYSYDVNDPESQIRNVYKKVSHPLFKPGKLAEADIALIQVHKPFIINELVQPVQLHDRSWQREDGEPAKQSCVVFGFGDIDFNTYDARLKYRKVLATHSDGCFCSRRNQWMNLVCLDPMEDVGLCPEDRGAPLVCSNKMVGMNHMLIRRNNCSEPFNPHGICGDYEVVSYFLYICPYLKWIRESVPTMPQPPSDCNQASGLFAPALFILNGLCFLLLFQ